ncbi:MAG: M16 family metallopeptidase [Holosporales bacterium]
MLSRVYLAFSVFVLAACAWATQGEIPYQVHQLANGLRIVVVENKRAPVVLHKVYFGVGGLDDPRGKSGLAHFLEHMMFKGAPDTPPQVLSDLIHRVGGVMNATTTPETTDYYAVVHKQYLAEVMAIEAQRLKTMYFEDKEVAAEIQVVLEERRMRVDNEPTSTLLEAMRAASTWHHSSRLPTIGWEHEIKSYTPEDVRAFHTAWYAPNNAVLLLAGDITFEQARELAERYYGPLPPRTVAARNHLIEPLPANISQRLDKVTPNIATPLLIQFYRAPSWVDGFTHQRYKEVIALQLMISCLAKGRSTPLWKKLVEEQKIATHVGLTYLGGLAPGVIAVVAKPSSQHSLESLEKALNKELKNLVNQGITAAQFEQAKNRGLVDRSYTHDNLLAAADHLVQSHMVGIPLEVANTWPETFKAINLQEVNSLMRTVFASAPYVVGALHPESQGKDRP